MRKARGSVSFTHAEEINTINNPHINNSAYFHQSSQAERTIIQYKVDSSVYTKVYPKSRIKFPYDNIINFFGNFPSSFRGCFFCEKEDPYLRSDCLKGTWSSDDLEKKLKFPLNLWNHKSWKNKDSTVWYLRLVEKTKGESVHAFNENQTKQDHYGPLTIIPIHGTPTPSNSGDRQIEHSCMKKKEIQRIQRR